MIPWWGYLLLVLLAVVIPFGAGYFVGITVQRKRAAEYHLQLRNTYDTMVKRLNTYRTQEAARRQKAIDEFDALPWDQKLAKLGLFGEK